MAIKKERTWFRVLASAIKQWETGTILGRFVGSVSSFQPFEREKRLQKAMEILSREGWIKGRKLVEASKKTRGTVDGSYNKVETSSGAREKVTLEILQLWTLKKMTV